MGFSEELATLNRKLAERGCKARIEQRKNALALRATLPPKPGRSGGVRQQRIPLGLAAVVGSLHEAELKALTLSTQLRSGTFTWETWKGTKAQPGKPVITRAFFEETARLLHAEKYAEAPERGAEAWRKRWVTALR